ncbi:MAG: helix-turn-helix domain-containing protein [Promethearchaeota archaeon]
MGIILRELILLVSERSLGLLGLDTLVKDVDRAEFKQMIFSENGKYTVVVYYPRRAGDDKVRGGFPPKSKKSRIMGKDGEYEVLVADVTPKVPFPADIIGFSVVRVGPLVFERGKGLTIRLLANQEDLIGVMNEFRAKGLKFKIKRVVDWEGAKDKRKGAELTNRQKRLFKYALQNGYFKIPRKISTKQIARYFSISTVAALEHLRKAQRKILTSFFKNEKDEA